MQLIYTFDFAYAKSRFSHVETLLISMMAVSFVNHIYLINQFVLRGHLWSEKVDILPILSISSVDFNIA